VPFIREFNMSTETQPEQVPGKFCDVLDALGATILDWTEITLLI
jgi:hypothetical protein